jgi:uncharacterized YigZ family protein
MEEYLALVEAGQDEIIEKKSRFIGYAVPAESEEEALAAVEKIKKKHYDARHNCYAFSIGTGPQPLLRFSDDAGKPILEVIGGSGVRNVCIVVTRYFGGTLLGTGGLVRAYTEAAKAALAAGVVKKQRPMIRTKLGMEYGDLGKLQYLIAQEDAVIADTIYEDRVTLLVDVYAPDYERFVKAVTEATGARVPVEKLEEFFG